MVLSREQNPESAAPGPAPEPGRVTDASGGTGSDRNASLSPLDAAVMLVRNWKLVLVLSLLLPLTVILWTSLQPRAYVATATFMPLANESRAAGGAAAIAQQFGIVLSGERPGQSPQFYIDLLRSRAVLRQAVESTYTILAPDGSPRRVTLVELYRQEHGNPGLPAWRKPAEQLRQQIAPSFSRETGMVISSVKAGQPALAEQVTQRLLEILDEFSTSVRQRRAQEEGRFASARLAESAAELKAAEDALQRFLMGNREFLHSPRLAFEHDRLQRQIVMRQEVYTSLLRLKEQARVDAFRDTPLFTVIDGPEGTASPVRRATVSWLIMALLLGFVLAFFAAMAREVVRRAEQAGDPRYRELERLTRKVPGALRIWSRGEPGRRAAADD